MSWLGSSRHHPSHAACHGGGPWCPLGSPESHVPIHRRWPQSLHVAATPGCCHRTMWPIYEKAAHTSSRWLRGGASPRTTPNSARTTTMCKGYPAELDFWVAHIHNQKTYVVSCHILFLLSYSITCIRVYPWYTLWLLDTGKRNKFRGYLFSKDLFLISLFYFILVYRLQI